MTPHHIFSGEDLLADGASVRDVMRALVFAQFLWHILSANAAHTAGEELADAFLNRWRRVVVLLGYGGAFLQKSAGHQIGMPPHVVPVELHPAAADGAVACRQTKKGR